MYATSRFESGILTLAIKGHIDSSRTRQLSEEIDSIIKGKEDLIRQIIVDADEMDFISSTGLRVMITLKKKYNDVSIINCNPDVYNIYKVTGLTNIFHVEKALERVSIKGLKKVEGLNNFYHLTDETMVKVFPKGTNKEDVEREVNISREVFVLGIPTAMTFDMVKVDDGYGLVMESVFPQDTDARTQGEMMRHLHEHIVEPGGLIPSAIEREKNNISQMKDVLGEDGVKKLTQLLSLIPEGSSLLHGHFTSDKVTFHNGEPIMIDTAGVGYGNPIIDLAYYYCSLPESLRGDYFDEFLHSYYDAEPEETIDYCRQNIVTLAMAQDFRSVKEQGGDLRGYFEENIAGRWDEILSKLHFKMDFAEEIRKLERKRFFTDSEVNIDWVASTLGTNRHYVSDYFNKVLHTPFNDYINNLRLEYAVELIRSGKVAPAQIPYSVGFNNDHTFRRLFKQKYGCTPGQFKP